MFTNTPRAVLTAEWTKIRSLRSSALTLALFAVLSVGLGVVNGFSARRAIDTDSPMLRPDFNPVNSGFVGISFGQLCLVAFGVLLISAEYGSGTIRASLIAVPQRGALYLGKIAVCTGLVLVLSYVIAFAAFLASQGALGAHGVGLATGEALRAVIGAPLYLTLVCLLAVGVGTLLRGSALSLTVMFAFIFLLSPVANNIEGLREVARYLPDYAGSQVMKVGSQADAVIGPWTGLLILFCWTVAVLAAGYVALRRRDG